MVPTVALLIHRAIMRQDELGGPGNPVYPRRTRLVAAVTAAAGLVCCWAQFQQQLPTAGIGLRPGVNAAVDFLDANRVSGPILNDFNNGGYLIFHRFHPGDPGQVFVDGRPEAYPAAFFNDVVVKMQADDTVWQQIDAQYRFNAIVFSLQRNASPETERFLLARVRDPEWAPVFADNFNLVYLRRTAKNTAAIKAYEIPRNQFR
jgi:hypothetical protein